MRILTVGDVVNENGCRYLREILPVLKKEKKIDLCIVNGENSDITNSISPASADFIFSVGADVITNGNHTYRRKEIYDYLDEKPFIIRPANFSPDGYGFGFTKLDMGYCQAAVINLMGAAYRDDVDNPFLCIDNILPQVEDCKIKILDFHADATGEKRAMGFYLDGKISVMFGTHTHVQTADECILPNGTGYISDLGMVGTEMSCLGVNPDCIISRLRDGTKNKLLHETGKALFGACIFDVDRDGKTVGVERILIRE